MTSAYLPAIALTALLGVNTESEAEQPPGPSLAPLSMRPLPLGTLKPRGWLKNQLQIQRDGLSGNLHEFWPDIKDSAWIGGEAEGWERAPYWLDGVIPLAWLLGDRPLKADVTRYMEYILTHQHANGWLGPRPEKRGEADIWSLFLALKILVQYHDVTQDERIPEAVERCLRRIDRHIDSAPLTRWAKFRSFEALIAIHWLYERTGETWLLHLGEKLRAQGFDWGGYFARWPGEQPTPKGRWSFMTHVVNSGMAVKAPALWWRQSKDPRDLQAAYDIYQKLDRHHGMLTGMFTGDECLAGLDPVHGTELCAVVEYMYSLEWLAAITGDPLFGDRLEAVTYNALPATFSPDMWTHQYVQQVNQVACVLQKETYWNTNGPDANLFGVEPNYGCCTSNLSQGWPKFAAHLWMTTADGLACVAYAPCAGETQINGAKVSFRVQTDYPFREAVRVELSVKKPAEFEVQFRVPAWAENATIEIDGTKAPMAPGTFHTLKRTWQGKTILNLNFPMQPRIVQRPNGAAAILRGPLAYALKIEEEWKPIHEDSPRPDYEIRPLTPWNYALALQGQAIEFQEHPVGKTPFSPDEAPVTATVMGRRLPQWTLENEWAGPLPASPVESAAPLEKLTLIPYGATNIRIAEFPVLAERHP